MAETEPQRRGLVVALQANYCWVALDHPGPQGQERLLCTRRTRLGKSGQRICAGDRVVVDGIDWSAGRAAVSGRQERSSLLERPAVANVDRVVVVVALAEPALDPLQLTRFLLTAEATGRPVQLVLSKADLVAPEAVHSWCERIGRWGYDAVPLALPAAGVDSDAAAVEAALQPLRQRLQQGGIAVLCGPSGVGKSSLLNALLPALELRVGAVSGRLRRGRHTTRHVELFPLTPGHKGHQGQQRALVADTPGFNRPELPLEASALAPLFPEIRHRLRQGSCRYSNCLHLDDPGCAVGSDWERHGHYRQCLQEIQARGSEAGPRAGAEEGLRRRGDRLEPRLQAQWRQPSRRRSRQWDAQAGDLLAEGSPAPLSRRNRADSDPDHR